jgi:hypothetical protein
MAGIVHAIGEGSDAGSTWFVFVLALSTAPALVLVTLRNFQGSVAK